MRIALVLMPWYRRESPSPELAMAISLLKKQNHKVYVFDINNEMFHNRFKERKYWKFFLLDASSETRDNFYREMEESFQYYASQILSVDPEAVVFKITGKTYYPSFQMAKALRQKDPKKKIILTGFLFLSKEDEDEFIRGQDNSFDFAILGEDEIALPKLIEALASNSEYQCDSLFRKDGRVYIKGNIVENLDELPFFDFSDFNLNAYKFPERLEFFISKGCPWRCSFCTDWLAEKKHRSMSGERIYEEVSYQSKIHKTKHFRFCDKTINGNINALEQFSDLMIRAFEKGDLPGEINWSGDAMIRPEMTKELLIKMRNAGCSGLGYGLESGSQGVLTKMGKRFSIPIAEEVLRNTHHAGIHTDVNILVGFPTETQADFEETLNFIKRNKENIDEVRLTFAGCRVYPRTILATNPEEFNLANTETDYWFTKDGKNTYEERIKRSEAVCQLVLSLGIKLRVNSRLTRKMSLAKDE